MKKYAASERAHKFARRSQAALEFLATYGWAFLVILIVIASLSYFGVLSPSKLLPDRCNFGSEFGCRAFTIAKNGINLRLSNNVGEAIIVSAISVASEKQPLTCTSPIVGTTPWKSGEVKDAPISCDFSNSGLTQGEKGKLNLKLSYYPARSSSSYSKDVNGEVFAVVQGEVVIPLFVLGDFEGGSVDGFGGYGPAPFSSTTSYGAQAGSYSLSITTCGSICTCCNYGGVAKGMPTLSAGTRYTISYWAKAISNPGDMHISVQNGAGDENCLSHSFLPTTTWQRFSNTCTLNIHKNTIYIWGSTPSQQLVMDGIQIELG